MICARCGGGFELGGISRYRGEITHMEPLVCVRRLKADRDAYLQAFRYASAANQELRRQLDRHDRRLEAIGSETPEPRPKAHSGQPEDQCRTEAA